MEEKGGYKPPHRRTQSSRPGTTRRGGRGSWRGSSRSNNNDKAEKDEVDGSMGMSSLELEKRRERFAGEAAAKKAQNGYGLVSRGEDNRLQRDPEARRSFFKEITREFTLVYGHGNDASLAESLGSLSLGEKGTDERDRGIERQKEKLSNFLMSLRKLREALLSSPPDEFTKSVFLFSIRTACRVGHYQTYVPSINYLLKHCDILSKSELHEIAYLHALHLSHFNQEHTKALEVLLEYCPGDLHLHQVLTTFRNLEYRTWLDLLHKEEDVPRYRLMQFGESLMCEHAVKCIQKSYFQLPEAYVKEMFGVDVEELVKKYKCPWRVANGTVVMRDRR